MVKFVILLRCSMFLTLFMFVSGACLAQKPELVVETGHSGAINALVFGHGGRTLFSGGADQTIKEWEVATGRDLRTLIGHTDAIRSLALSADGDLLASGSDDKTIKLWNLREGREIRTLTGHSDAICSIALSGDGKLLVSGSRDKTIKVWNLVTGEVRTLTGHLGEVQSVALSVDGKILASGSTDKTVRVWNLATGEVRVLTGHLDEVRSVALSSDGQILGSGSADKTVKLWNASSGAEKRTFTGFAQGITSVALSANGEKLATVSAFKIGSFVLTTLSLGTIQLWNVNEGTELRSAKTSASFSAFSPNGEMLAAGYISGIDLLEVSTGHTRRITGHSHLVQDVAFSADGKWLATSGVGSKLWRVGPDVELDTLGPQTLVNLVTFSADGTTLNALGQDLEVWDTTRGTALGGLRTHLPPFSVVALSPDGKIFAGQDKNQIRLWDLNTGRELHTINAYPGSVFVNRVQSLAFSADGQILASSGYVDLMRDVIKLWDVQTGQEVRTEGVRVLNQGRKVSFSPVEKILAIATYQTINFWDMATSREWHTPSENFPVVSVIKFAPDGETLASGNHDSTIKLWDVKTGREKKTLKGHSNVVNSIAFSADGKFLLSGSADATTKLWRVATGELLASLIALDENDWAIVTPQGHFDASPKGQKLMHWIIGGELVELAQLKKRYYLPGLLHKILDNQPLRDVSTFENPKLYPDVRYEPPARGGNTVVMTLTNRGGGIGRVQVFVNDKEFLDDARDETLKRNPYVPKATLNVDLSKARNTISGARNDIRVVAWNVENYISSRGEEKPWVASGSTSREPPEVYAVVAGISQYDGAKLNLKFAGKDAVDMGNAIELGAKRLFGVDKVHLTLLTTYGDPRAIAPTRENFTKAFSALIKQAKPKDILIVYFAGHAITFQQGGNDIYCYLTQEAETTDVSDPAVRKQRTVTSDDLRDWIKQIPANKQAVILDTCAAGAAQDPLMAAARAGEGDALRAVELAMDRTGSHFLMGSAADAQSYETTEYGQGLLTLALLRGIKGEALNDNGIVDVNTLFRFARDEVEKLAWEISKIQKPKISAPKGDTFPLGRITTEDQQKIVLATPKPMILRPNFQESSDFGDPLNLMKEMRELLRDETESRRGRAESVFQFTDRDDYSGGIQPVGRYTIDGENVTVELRLRRAGKPDIRARIVGSRKEIAARLIEAIKAAVVKF